MPRPKPSWKRAVEGMRANLAELDSPQYRAEALLEDLNPRNFLQIDQEMARRDRQRPSQQQALMDERQRLEALQAQYVTQQAQQFPQRLAQSLDLAQRGTPLTQTPEAFMAKLMAMMQRRVGMPRQQLGGPEIGPTSQVDY